MRTTLLHQQHSKCIAILYLIQKADDNIKGFKETIFYLASIGAATGWHKRRLDRYKAIKARLVLYYSNQFMKLVNPVAEAMEKNSNEVSENIVLQLNEAV